MGKDQGDEPPSLHDDGLANSDSISLKPAEEQGAPRLPMTKVPLIINIVSEGVAVYIFYTLAELC